jgi:hypothetical protein
VYRHLTTDRIQHRLIHCHQQLDMLPGIWSSGNVRVRG